MWEVVRAKQKEFYFSNMGETALEEEPRGTLNIMIFLKLWVEAKPCCIQSSLDILCQL